MILAGQIWDAQGGVRERLTVPPDPAGLSPDVLDAVMASLRPALGEALAGKCVNVQNETHGRALSCQLVPLRTPEGAVNAVLALVSDVTERTRFEARLFARVAFEKQIAELSSQFINLAPEEVDPAISDALARIGALSHVDRAYLFLFSEDGASMSNSHEWCAPGLEPNIDTLGELPVSILPWLTARLRRREVIYVERVADLPAEASAERHIFGEQSIRSTLVLPLGAAQGVVGFLGFDAVRAEKSWAEEDIALMKTVGEIFVSALQRKRAEGERKLLEAQLVQTRSLENVAKLAGGVAHDFNNLLGVILNYSDMLKRELSDPRHIGYLTELHESARQAAHLTRQLLLVGRRGVVAPIALDLNEAVGSLADLLRRALGEHIELKLELTDDLGIIRVGLPQIEQVILNLTMNARDAMPTGGAFTLRTETVELDADYAARFIDLKPGRYTLLTASDNGVGMTPEVASRALDPFFSTKASFGTGLGLSTVHGIVKQAGGHLIFATAPGAGCTVRLFFPVVDESPPPRAKTPPSGAPKKGAGETILVVEDSPSVRKLVTHALSQNGYRVLEAGTPFQALQILHQSDRPIDLLLTDVILPEMSGRILADRMREQGKVRRVLFMSGYDNDLVARQGVLHEGVRLLQKPFLEPELLREVRLVLDS
ncbi:MAG TPA: response regulator [Polyangiaceae bacterium]|nr:response regulator [Polyangiaceae bacterium]